MSTLPPTHRALVQEVYGEPLLVKELPTSQPTSGSAILKILYGPVISYMRDVYNGKRQYVYPTPLTLGTSAIGLIAALGPDATSHRSGDLIYVDCTIHSRDHPSDIILLGISQGGTSGSEHLMEGEWRHGTFAEYAKVPLENIFKLDEGRLCGELGYSVPQLCWMLIGLVPYGGLRSVRVQAGETVIVAPATERLGGLKKVGGRGRVETVQIVRDVEREMEKLGRFGKADVFFYISPQEACTSTHFQAAMQSLKRGGRVSLMGGLREWLVIPHRFVMRFDITLKGKWMYSREDNLAFANLISSGVLNVRGLVKVVAEYQLEDYEEAFQTAWDHGRLGELVVFRPCSGRSGV